MRSSRLVVLFAILSSLVVTACGDDGGSTQPDAKIFLDAPPVVIDAPPAGGPAEALGKVCSKAMPCPASAPICATVGTVGFCTAICGNTPEAAMEPPANGNAMCAAITPASPAGTAACILTAPPMGGTKDWACGLACGTVQGMELGGCPTGLTCSGNLCQ